MDRYIFIDIPRCNNRARKLFRADTTNVTTYLNSKHHKLWLGNRNPGRPGPFVLWGKAISHFIPVGCSWVDTTGELSMRIAGGSKEVFAGISRKQATPVLKKCLYHS